MGDSVKEGSSIRQTCLRSWVLAATLLATVMGLFCWQQARRSFSGTFDESNHLACGLEWWQFGTYSQWTENPPLPRMAIAAVPYLLGMRLPEQAAWDPRTHEWNRSWEVGLDLLYGGAGYDTNLGRARLGTLPFFLLVLAAVWGLAGGWRRPGAGLVAVTLTATLPTFFAHAALATTDVAFAGAFLTSLLFAIRWFERPTKQRASAMGAAFALALACKFSALVFFPAAIVSILAARRWARVPGRPAEDAHPMGWRTLVGHLALASGVAFLVTWASYRFSVGRIDELPWEVKDWLRLVPAVEDRGMLGAWFLHARLPMPEFFHGLRFLAAHDAAGHEAYLLGQISNNGFRGFYPIALAVKTPWPTLVAVALAIPLVLRRAPARWVSAATMLAAVAVVMVAMRSQINLGIRHVFFVLPLAIVAAARVLDKHIARQGIQGRILLGTIAVLLVAQAAIAVSVRRTALGYFNFLAGPEPAKVLLDSDLDWGQDLVALRSETRARGVDRLQVAYFGMARLCQHGLPPLDPLLPGRPSKGWIAISENYYRNRSMFMLLKDPCDPTSVYREGEVPLGSFAWLEAHRPVALVGSSIRLYHLP